MKKQTYILNRRGKGSLNNIVPTDLYLLVDESKGVSNSYSTFEQLTGGTWIDGKPIYRLVLEVNVDIEYKEVNVAYLEVQSVISINRLINDVYDNGSQNNDPAIFGGDIIQVNNQDTIRNYKIILEYTKREPFLGGGE
jgi:hypothetical protein